MSHRSQPAGQPRLVQEVEDLLRQLEVIESNRSLKVGDRAQALLECAGELRRLNRRYAEICSDDRSDQPS